MPLEKLSLTSVRPVSYFGLAARMVDMPSKSPDAVPLRSLLIVVSPPQFWTPPTCFSVPTTPSSELETTFSWVLVSCLVMAASSSCSASLVSPRAAIDQLWLVADPHLLSTAGSRRVNVDLVDADVDFTGTVPTDNQQFRRKRSPVDEAPSRLNSRAPVLYADTPVYGLIYSPYIPGRDYLNNFASLGGAAPFSDYQIPWTGGYATADGTLANAETGKQYRVLLRYVLLNLLLRFVPV